MDATSVRLPNSLRKTIKVLAREDNISMNQYLITAASEKASAQKTAKYIQERIARGSKVDIDSLLAKVPSVEPPDYDKR
jgi:predicted DNA-binding ribbon-helix-helix protein